MLDLSASGVPTSVVLPPSEFVDAVTTCVVSLAPADADVVTGLSALVVSALVLEVPLSAALLVVVALVVVEADTAVGSDKVTLVCVITFGAPVVMPVALALVVATGDVVAVPPLTLCFATVDASVVAPALGATVVVRSAPTVVKLPERTTLAVFLPGSTVVAPLLSPCVVMVSDIVLVEGDALVGVALVPRVVVVVGGGSAVGGVC